MPRYTTSQIPRRHRTVRFPIDLYAKIERLSEDEMRSFNDQVIFMLTQYDGIRNGEKKEETEKQESNS